MISVVIPTSFANRGVALLKRLEHLVDSKVFAQHELIVAHGSRDGRLDAELRRYLERSGIRYHWDTRPRGERLSISGLRNAGAGLASGDALLFFDVDLWVESAFAKRSLAFFERSEDRFLIIPCLYATQQGSRPLERHDDAPVQALSLFYRYERQMIAFLALNTSTLLVSKDAFAAHGGFDSAYLDHGLEDFDLLMRLCLPRWHHKVPTDLNNDTPSHSPAFARGFRALLNLFSLPLLLEELCTVHLWHPRPARLAYYGNRSNNRQIFEKNLTAAADAPKIGSSSTRPVVFREDGTIDSLLAVHDMLVTSGLGRPDYSALFDNNPQHHFHTDGVRRKLAKLWRQWLQRLRSNDHCLD